MTTFSHHRIRKLYARRHDNLPLLRVHHGKDTASGIADTLITRAAAVTMKEGRKLIIVPRETPISAIMIENELKLARAGAIILPASPGSYSMPTTVAEMVDFVVGKVLDHLGQENTLFTDGKASRRPPSIDERIYPIGRSGHQGDHTSFL